VSTQDIYNYLRVNNQLITAGQPNEEQITSAAEEGVTTIINLATINPQSSLPDEGALVRSHGMNYYHIPVDWGNPQESDFDTFEKIFKRISGEKSLVHCAANFRVTAFYSLYAIKHLGWSEAQADEFRASIWKGSNHPVWEEFIAAMKTKIKR
jgi:protein tyrosine phosphatase (PTP) superfamily phosphohydrolase (DUF442 family)